MKRLVIIAAVALLSACGGGTEEEVKVEGLTTPAKLSVVPVN